MYLNIIEYNKQRYPCIQVLIKRNLFTNNDRLVLENFMNTASCDTFIWNSEVLEQEIDIQGIVNNAVYLQYFDQGRIQHLLSKGVDWEIWHQNGYNFVLIHVDMEIKNSLTLYDKFYVTSKYEKVGRLKIIFHQTIHKKDNNRLIAKAINTIACVSLCNGKPVMPGNLLTSLFTSNIIE